MENLKIKNKNIDGKQKTRYKITLVYQETYAEGTNIYAKYNMPLKLAETYSAGMMGRFSGRVRKNKKLRRSKNEIQNVSINRNML